MRALLIAGFFIACSGSPKSTPVAAVAAVSDAPAIPTPPASPPAAGAPLDPDRPSGAAAKRDAELAALVSGYVDATLDSAQAFTRDGKQVVLVSNRDGLPQVYLGASTGPATRIVTTQQRVGEALAAPGGKDIIFTSDTGADENWAFYRVGLDGKNLIELTTGKLNRDRPFVPDGRPSQLYFTARTLASAKSTLYVTSSTALAEPKALYTDDKPATLRDVSPDGSLAVVRRYPSRGDNTLVRVDLATGAAEPIYPAQGKASIFDAAFARDNKRVYVATDGGEEQSLLLVLDARSGTQLAKHAFGPTTQISRIAVSRETGLIAISLFAGTRSEIRVLDGRSLAERTVIALPPGTGAAPEFSVDGKQLLITWSTPERPTDVFLADPRSGKATPRGEPRPTLPTAFAVDASTIDVRAFDGGKIPTNVLLAKGAAGKKQPVAVLFHGGPAGISTLRWSPATAVLIAAGYAVVEPNIRGSSGFGRAFEAADNGPKRGDSFKDVETVSRWAAAQPWADKDRMIVLGGSWGGYLTLIALTRWPELWRAGIDLFGVVDLRTTLATTSGVLRQTSLDEIGDPDKDGAFLTSISPITDITKLVDPLFVYAGANDPRVPRPESDMVVRALRARRVAVEYMVADNEGHSVSRRENQVALYSRMLRFLEQNLR